MAYKFKLKAGTYEDDSGRYEPGAIVESDTDLAKRFGRDKFEPLGGGPTPKSKAAAAAEATAADETEDEGEGDEPNRETFEAMTVAELKEYADDNEIDISGAVRKEEIIDKILEGLEG